MWFDLKNISSNSTASKSTCIEAICPEVEWNSVDASLKHFPFPTSPINEVVPVHLFSVESSFILRRNKEFRSPKTDLYRFLIPDKPVKALNCLPAYFARNDSFDGNDTIPNTVRQALMEYGAFFIDSFGKDQLQNEGKFEKVEQSITSELVTFNELKPVGILMESPVFAERSLKVNNDIDCLLELGYEQFFAAAAPVVEYITYNSNHSEMHVWHDGPKEILSRSQFSEPVKSFHHDDIINFFVASCREIEIKRPLLKDFNLSSYLQCLDDVFGNAMRDVQVIMNRCTQFDRQYFSLSLADEEISSIPQHVVEENLVILSLDEEERHLEQLLVVETQKQLASTMLDGETDNALSITHENELNCNLIVDELFDDQSKMLLDPTAIFLNTTEMNTGIVDQESTTLIQRGSEELSNDFADRPRQIHYDTNVKPNVSPRGMKYDTLILSYVDMEMFTGEKQLVEVLHRRAKKCGANSKKLNLEIRLDSMPCSSMNNDVVRKIVIADILFDEKGDRLTVEYTF